MLVFRLVHNKLILPSYNSHETRRSTNYNIHGGPDHCANLNYGIGSDFFHNKVIGYV